MSTQNPLENLLTADALVARLMERLTPAARQSIVAGFTPQEQGHVDAAIERDALRHRYCECCA